MTRGDVLPLGAARKLPHVQILVDRRDTEAVVNGHEDKADDGVRQQHSVQGLPHGAAAIIQLGGVSKKGTDAQSSTGY